MATEQETNPTAQVTETAMEAPAVDMTEARLQEARAIVRHNVKWAAGIGILPIPLVDFVGITTIQLRMLKKLGALYDIPFFDHTVKNLLSSLLVGMGSMRLGASLAGGLVKMLPGVGTLLGLTVLPTVAGALTHATGNVFIAHFESGGNFLDFKPEAVRAHFRSEFEAAQERLKNQGNQA